MNNELPCDTELIIEPDPEIQGDPLPEPVRAAAAKLFELFMKENGGTGGTPTTSAPAPEIQAGAIVKQPPLPKIFQLIIANDNERRRIRAKGHDIENGGMTQADWRHLKELTAYKKNSLRPGAVKATSYSDHQ